MTVALIGDYSLDVTAHRAIPLAIDLASDCQMSYQWIHTNTIELATLKSFAAFWCVPASPYANMDNVLAVIEYARLHNIPFLGTCGGYQHAALEYAKNALGHCQADNSEVNPETTLPLISPLACKLYNVKNAITLTDNSLIRSIYGKAKVTEEYYCGYGINAQYLSLFDKSDLCFCGFDADGDPKALEIKKIHFLSAQPFSRKEPP
ncbi:MAG: hypothetical protein AAFZ92_00280 [Pseudomonadota bacterium]